MVPGFRGPSPVQWGQYLWLRSQVDDGVKGEVGFTLLQDPGVPVQVNTPLCFCQITALKEVGRKHIP